MSGKNDDIDTAAMTRGVLGKLGFPALAAILGLYFVYTNWGTISTAAKKLELVGNNREQIEEILDWQSETNLILIDLKDFKGDTTDLLARRRVEIDANTQNHVEQKNRATMRIGDHRARDVINAAQSAAIRALEARNDASTRRLIESLEGRVRELEKNDT